MNVNWRSAMENLTDSFFDDQAMAGRRVPGAAVAIVNDGQMVTRGFGYADRHNRVIVHADETVFRVGSVARLLTAIAILQLVERGLLKLDDPVNEHLRTFRVRNPFPNNPLTVANLLTHTDGFEAPSRALYALTPTDPLPLRELLANELPPVSFPPGQQVTYSAWGAALAACVVEQVSGKAYEQYIDANILQPLEMLDSSFRPDLPPERMKRFATVHYDAGGAYDPMPFLYPTIPQVDAFTTTVTDMARLIGMLLNGGCYREARILPEAAVQSMFRQRFTPHVGLPGVTYGFMEHCEGNQRALIVDGSGVGVRSRLALLPDHSTGFFIVTNTDNDAICYQLTSVFLRHFQPVQTPPLAPPANFKALADRFAGTYRYMQHDQTTVAKLQALNRGTVQVTNNGDGTLSLTPLGRGDIPGGFEQATRLIPVEPTLFQRADTGEQVAFQENPNGLIIHLYSGGGYHHTYKKLAATDDLTFQRGVFWFCTIMFITGVLFWGLPALTASPAARAEESWFAGLVAGGVSLFNLLFVGGLYAYLNQRKAGITPLELADGIPGAVRALFILPLLNVLLTLALLFYTIVGLQEQFWDEAAIHYILLAIAAVAFLWLLNRWNLFGFRFGRNRLATR
ncbi:MAG: beta-lactamase family protein [Anaerolineae bacterium]|nr:beta-lactamase family protein [Anaerolineae bacterium]